MFRHHGKNRRFKHNFRIAIVLSFVAGVVNVVGFISIQELTTNVTGHFALFMNEIVHLNVWTGLVYILYIFFFLAGAFTSSLLIERGAMSKQINALILPTLIEAILLIAAAFYMGASGNRYPAILACTLLFAMGLQNSYVTRISNAVVRTTHLTGLFTDLGIELSQLLYPRTKTDRKRIIATVKLRVFIISFFFLGGIFGGISYSTFYLGAKTLIFAALILLINLVYDYLRYQLIRRKRKVSGYSIRKE